MGMFLPASMLPAIPVIPATLPATTPALPNATHSPLTTLQLASQPSSSLGSAPLPAPPSAVGFGSGTYWPVPRGRSAPTAPEDHEEDLSPGICRNEGVAPGGLAGSVEEGGEHSELHSCCNSTSRKRKPPVTNIFTWLQGYASLVGALSTAYLAKVLELMAYQTTILRCYRDFEGPAWAQYDRAYHRQAALSKDLNWSRINTTL